MTRISVRHATHLRGELSAPPDKSISHRAVILASLAHGTSRIRNFLAAQDPERTLFAFRQMGIGISIEKDRKTSGHPEEDGPVTHQLTVQGKGLSGLRKPPDFIDCGNSGTTMRLLCGVLSGQSFPVKLTGDASLSRRPMKRVIDPLSQMGAAFESSEGGRPPLLVRGGQLKALHYQSPVASAQVKSAILLAGLYCEGTTSVTEPAQSRDHTERMLGAAGVPVTTKGLTVSITGRARLKPLDLTVPGDFSSAAFFLVAASLIPGSEIVIRNAGINPTRTGLMDILLDMGAHITIENEQTLSGESVADLRVRHARLSGIDIDASVVPRTIDEFPVLCVAAARARGVTRIRGAQELRVKESDRIATIASELQKMGVPVTELADGLDIEGCDHLRPARIESHGDHRIAMAMAVAALCADGETIIDDADCIDTSFPGFVAALRRLQA